MSADTPPLVRRKGLSPRWRQGARRLGLSVVGRVRVADSGRGQRRGVLRRAPPRCPPAVQRGPSRAPVDTPAASRAVVMASESAGGGRRGVRSPARTSLERTCPHAPRTWSGWPRARSNRQWIRGGSTPTPTPTRNWGAISRPCASLVTKVADSSPAPASPSRAKSRLTGSCGSPT